MDSFQTLYTLTQKACQNETTSILPFIKADINRGVHILEGELKLPPFEKTRDITTTTSAEYPFPQDMIRLKELYSTVSSIRYPSAQKINDEETWNIIKSGGSGQAGNIITHYFVRPGAFNIEIFPTPSSAGNTIRLVYEAVSIDMSADDYSTGTITTLANGGTVVTGSGTTFTQAMVGRWFKTDDNYWYLINSYTSATVIGLKQLYQGTAISAGSSAFTIGEMSRLPVPFQRAPVTYAAYRHFLERQRDAAMARIYQAEWESIKIQAKQFSTQYTSSIIPSNLRLRRQFGMRNINDYPESLS